MQYVFLAYGDEQSLKALSAHERETFENACQANNELLRQSGHLRSASKFHSSHTATSVRIRNGVVSVADGPVWEANEQLVGLFFINARDLNEAIQLAARMPQARGGPIEVRSVLEFESG